MNQFPHTATDRTEQIALLNDALRDFAACPGHNRIVLTAGIGALLGDTSEFSGFRRRAALLRMVRDYRGFDEDTNPHRERDFGSFAFEGVRCFWKIDYYDRDLQFGSDDPSDPNRTCRVLTILRADEY